MEGKEYFAGIAQALRLSFHLHPSSSSSTALTCRIVLDGKPRARSFPSISSRGAVACAHSGIAAGAPGAFESLAMATKISSRRERITLVFPQPFHVARNRYLRHSSHAVQSQELRRRKTN